MKIITLERKTIDGKPVVYGVGENGDDYRDWWCVIETKAEEEIYDRAFGWDNSASYIPVWNDLVKKAGEPFGLAWGDDDIYGYLRPDEDCPDIKEEFIDGEGDTWVRVE